MYVHAYMCMYTYIIMYVYVYIYIYICRYIYIYIFIHICIVVIQQTSGHVSQIDGNIIGADIDIYYY